MKESGSMGGPLGVNGESLITGGAGVGKAADGDDSTD